MENKITYIAGILICLYFFGCSSGEYEIKEVKVDYTEKQLVYDTIDTEKPYDTSTAYNNQNKNEVTTKENFSFIVQIGAFVDPSNFNNFFAMSKSKLGEGVYYQLVNNLYKIRIGNYNNKAEALKMLEYVKGLGFDDAFVITVKNK